MDRDYYRQRHEEELEAAANAACEASRRAHQELACAYEVAAALFGRPVVVVSNQRNRSITAGDRPREARAS